MIGACPYCGTDHGGSGGVCQKQRENPAPTPPTPRASTPSVQRLGPVGTLSIAGLVSTAALFVVGSFVMGPVPGWVVLAAVSTMLGLGAVFLLTLLSALPPAVSAPLPALRHAITEDPERARIALELRQSQARFASLFSSGIIGIVIADNHGRFLEVNDAFLRMVGYTKEEFDRGTMQWAVLTPPEFKEQSHTAAKVMHDHGFAGPWEKEYLHKDGTRISVLVGVAEVDANSTIRFVADLTERKKAEEKRRQAQTAAERAMADRLRAEEALHATEVQLAEAQKMEAVGRLAGGVAHHFNNVLAVILSYAESLLEELPQGGTLHSDIEQMRLAARQAADLTQKLLLFSRQNVPVQRVIDLHRHLSDSEPALRRALGNGVELHLRTKAPRARIRIDPIGFQQAILNLATNAKEAMPGGGRLVLETREAVVDAQNAADHPGVAPGQYVVLSFRDNGVGMDAETQSHVFEPFFTTRTRGEGSGLGLSIAFGIVEQAGGHIGVESELGQGTTFALYLPITDAPLSETSPQRSGAWPVIGRRSLS
jgi:two-component system, cell cycle sensor histidine kinase and response regulator CckA